MDKYYDIKNWRNPGFAGGTAYLKILKDNKKSELKSLEYDLSDFESKYVYALFDAVLDMKPNGLMTITQEASPIENPFWWDFVIQSNFGFISVIRGATKLEVHAKVKDDSFDLQKFFSENINKFNNEIEEKIGSYSLLKTYINHFRSYRECTKSLSKSIEELNLTVPSIPGDNSSKKLMEEYNNKQLDYIQASIQFHALGKSLILNSAFMVESFITLLIRFTAGPELQKQKHLLSLHLHSNFKTKLQNLHTLSLATASEVDLEDRAVIKAFELMTLRNKYVHSDESSHLNRLEDIYFDSDFPLIDTDNDAILDTIKSTYYNPDYIKVTSSYQDAENFIKYIYSIIKPDQLDKLKKCMNQSRVVFNESVHKYELVYPENTVMAVF